MRTPAGRNHPNTSHAAARRAKVRAGSQGDGILAALKWHGPLTASQLSARLATHPAFHHDAFHRKIQIRPRLSVLFSDGIVERHLAEFGSNECRWSLADLPPAQEEMKF